MAAAQTGGEADRLDEPTKEETEGEPAKESPPQDAAPAEGAKAAEPTAQPAAAGAASPPETPEAPQPEVTDQRHSAASVAGAPRPDQASGVARAEPHPERAILWVGT